MKFNVEIELDWMEDDGSIDDAVKEQVIFSIREKVSKQAQEKIVLEVSERLDTVVDDRLNTFIEQWTSQKIEVTDKWGEVVSDCSIIEMLKKKFDSFWTASVDKNGRSGGDTYGKTQSRMDWAMTERIKKHCEQFAKDMEKRFTKEVESQVSEALKSAVGNKLIDTLGMPELLERIKGESLKLKN